MRAIVITPGRPAEVVEQEWNLDQLQEAVGGFIEALPNPWGDAVVYVNEDGKRHGLPVNESLSHHLAISLDGDQVLGTAVVCGLNLETADVCDVDPLLIDLLARPVAVQERIARFQAENAANALQFGIAAALSGKTGEKAAVEFLRMMSTDIEALWDTALTEVEAEVTAAVEATLVTLMCVLEGGPWLPPRRLNVETEEVS